MAMNFVRYDLTLGLPWTAAASVTVLAESATSQQGAILGSVSLPSYPEGIYSLGLSVSSTSRILGQLKDSSFLSLGRLQLVADWMPLKQAASSLGDLKDASRAPDGSWIF